MMDGHIILHAFGVADVMDIDLAHTASYAGLYEDKIVRGVDREGGCRAAGGGGEKVYGPLYGLEEPGKGNGFDQIVQYVQLEPFERIIGIRRTKDDLIFWTDHTGQVETAEL